MVGPRQLYPGLTPLIWIFTIAVGQPLREGSFLFSSRP
jgi:hypothetical protein